MKILGWVKSFAIFLHASLLCVYHITEAIQAVEDNHFGWCIDTLCIASSHVWFKSHIDECTMSSNLKTNALKVRTRPKYHESNSCCEIRKVDIWVHIEIRVILFWREYCTWLSTPTNVNNY